MHIGHFFWRTAITEMPIKVKAKKKKSIFPALNSRSLFRLYQGGRTARRTATSGQPQNVPYSNHKLSGTTQLYFFGWRTAQKYPTDHRHYDIYLYGMQLWPLSDFFFATFAYNIQQIAIYLRDTKLFSNLSSFDSFWYRFINAVYSILCCDSQKMWLNCTIPFVWPNQHSKQFDCRYNSSHV